MSFGAQFFSKPRHTSGCKMVMPIPDVEVTDPRDFGKRCFNHTLASTAAVGSFATT